MDETGIYACDDGTNVYKYDLLNRSVLASVSQTYMTKNGYETVVTLDVDSIFIQHPISSFEALVNASFSLNGVTVQSTPGWKITAVPIDSESLDLSYVRDTSVALQSGSPSISIIYLDSNNADINLSITPVLVNGQPFTQCLGDTSYTFHPGCTDPILREALNGEPLQFRIFQQGGSNILDADIPSPANVRIEALNSLGMVVGTSELGQLNSGHFQYDLNELFPRGDFNFVQVLTDDGVSVFKVFRVSN
jgi:hypothetical protein